MTFGALAISSYTVLCSHWSFECTAVPLLGQGPAICCTIIDLGCDLSSERILKLVFPRMRERQVSARGSLRCLYDTQSMGIG